MTANPDKLNDGDIPTMGSMQLVGLPSPLERDNRKIPEVTREQFIAFCACIPIWIVIVLPSVVIYQIGYRICRLLGILEAPPRPPFDSNIVAPDTISPRTKRKYDMVVLGCTGFTGRLAARHLAKKYGVNKTVKWALAGRSLEKISAVKKSLADELNMPEISKLDAIVVDANDSTTMPGLVKDTRVVATTAGPYQQIGSPVVEACAKYGTHYVDITGEVGWVRNMIKVWGQTARESGSILLPFCGHDCIPWDLTVWKLNQALREKCQDDLETVKVWDETVSAAPGGTYATALLNLEGNGVNSPRGGIDPFLQLLDGTKSTYTTRESLPVLPEPFFDGKWTTPFVMAVVNGKIIRWTHALGQKGAKKLSYRETLVHADFKTAFVSHIGLLVSGTLLLNPVTKWIAHRLFLPRQGEGPSYVSMEKDNYLLVTAEGLGSNGNRAESTFYFKQDPGCLETARMLVESGLALALNESELDEKLPYGRTGGFFPPAACLGDVLMERLAGTGAEFNLRVIPKEENAF